MHTSTSTHTHTHSYIYLHLFSCCPLLAWKITYTSRRLGRVLYCVSFETHNGKWSSACLVMPPQSPNAIKTVPHLHWPRLRPSCPFRLIRSIVSRTGHLTAERQKYMVLYIGSCRQFLERLFPVFPLLKCSIIALRVVAIIHLVCCWPPSWPTAIS